MNNCNALHEIQITNYNNNDNVQCQILLLKGQIKNHCDHPEIFTSVNKSKFNVSKKNGNFKCILPLVEGVNTITLNYCSASHTITILHNPERGKCFVKVLYIVCNGHDGCFQSPLSACDAIEACNKISLGIQLVQCLFAEKLKHKTFQIESDCVPFRVALHVEEAYRMEQQQLWEQIGREIIASPMGNKTNWKFVAFLGCTRFEGIQNNDFSYQNIRAKTVAAAALGGGDLALFGTGCLYTWPTEISNVIGCFQSNQPVDRCNFLDDSNNRRTYGGCFATTLGSLCHEIGHIFDLGHTSNGIMGDGFDFVHRVFTIDNLTDNIPGRVVGASDKQEKPQRHDSRLTKLKKTNDFLVKYQEQKDNDLTFFADSSAITLTHHKWFNCYDKDEHQSNLITINENRKLVNSKHWPIRLIELREKQGALMKHFYSINGEQSWSFEIPDNTKNLDVFVMDVYGNVKIFE